MVAQDTANVDFRVYKIRYPSPTLENHEEPSLFKIQDYKEEMGESLKQICFEYLKDFI